VATSISTPDRAGSDEVVVRADALGGRTVVRTLAGVQPWHPRVLTRRASYAVVALVATRATLIAGDEIGLSVTVGAGAALELVDIGATVAHDVRSGPVATIGVALMVEPGGSLVWCGRPLIAAAGCHARREVIADVGPGGRLLLGDTIVLGRAREQPGTIIARTRVTYDGIPLLDETLDTGDLATTSSPVVMNRSRQMLSLALAGVIDEDAPPGSMRAHGPGMLWRALEPREHADTSVAARWRSLVLRG